VIIISRKYNARSSLSRCTNSTKIVVRWGFAPHPLGELTALPQTPNCIQGALLLRLLLLRGGDWRRGKGREREGRYGRGRERRRGPCKIVHPEKFLRIGPADSYRKSRDIVSR